MELRLHSVTTEKGAKDLEHRGPRQHTKKPDLGLIQDAGEDQLPSSMSKVHAKGLKESSRAYWLQRMFLQWRRAFGANLQTVCHLALDVARARGKESLLAVFYSSSQKAAVWAPPMDC